MREVHVSTLPPSQDERRRRERVHAENQAHNKVTSVVLERYDASKSLAIIIGGL